MLLGGSGSSGGGGGGVDGVKTDFAYLFGFRASRDATGTSVGLANAARFAQ